MSRASPLVVPSPPFLRVALVSETWPPEVNGVTRTLGRLADGLRRYGHELQVVRPCQRDDDQPRIERGYREVLVPGLPLPRYPGLRFGVPAPGRLWRLWRNDPPDIVHIATEGPLGLAALGAARRLDLPVSTSYHTNFDAYSRHYGFGWLGDAVAWHLRRFHNRADLTLVPTRALAVALDAAGYRNVDVLGRGVDTTLFRPTRRSTTLREHWGVELDALVVAHVGRLAPEKNLTLLLDAYAAIHARRPDARLLLVGDGPLEEELRRRHPEFIHAGTRSGEDLAAHYASADLFLFPSLTETFGNVALEALASGLAVVAFDYAAAAEHLRDWVSGRLVPCGDAAAFVAAAANLATSPHALATLRRNAADTVAKLGWDAIQERFADVLGATASRHANRHALVASA